MKAYQKTIFGQLDEQTIYQYTFENDLGYRFSVMNYGATILEYSTPDKNGTFENIVLGFDNFEQYVGNSFKYGASIGPVAGRIAKASFELDDTIYKLEANNGKNTNHSGTSGWDATVFELVKMEQDGLTFYTERANGTGGFPGNLKVWISYKLTAKGEVEISYQVQTDQDTLVNPTNHSYFNLSADEMQPIDTTIFQLHTTGIYPISEESIPQPQQDAARPIVTALQQGCSFGEIFASDDEQIRLVNGLDHPFELEAGCELAGSLYHPASGRYLTFKTDCPTVVVYTSNSFDQTIQLGNKTLPIHNGVALETQVLPNAIHTSKREQVILRAGHQFTSTTVYYASVKEDSLIV